jgi:hypothetical protein
MAPLTDDDVDLDPDDLELFSSKRNPNGTFGVAAVVWIIDRRPFVLYEECVDVVEELQLIEKQAEQYSETVARTMARAKRKTFSRRSKKLCVRCKERHIDGNRTDVCHFCSKIDDEKNYGRGGKGGREAAKMETRFQMEREELKRRNKEALEQARRQAEVERGRLESALRHAQITASTNEKDSVILKLVEQICAEDPQSEFAKWFAQKLALARLMATNGWAPVPTTAA